MQISSSLSEQLPEGFELLSVSIAKAGTSFVPSSATYVLPVRRQCVAEDLKARIKQVLASESIRLERKTGPESWKSKTLDVRGFLKSIELEDSCVIVRCNVSPRRGDFTGAGAGYRETGRADQTYKCAMEQ
jgi:hypothetical protein